ncbi:MAG: hypothetical protein ACI828_002907 [Flavobacteriales bacterium]|jgi:hypothetical protein
MISGGLKRVIKQIQTYSCSNYFLFSEIKGSFLICIHKKWRVPDAKQKKPIQ